jgi:zinc transporter, ZIP family
MEATARAERAPGGRLPAWALGLIPLALIAAAIGAFALLGGPGLGERTGPPVEEVAVERTVLRPGEIELTLRNDGPDPVEVAQVAINDAYAPFTTSDGREIERLGSTTLRIQYPWIEGEAYEIFVLTSSGGTIDAAIPVASETPEADLGFYGLMALLGIYVGVIPVSLGMLWLPFVRRVDARWIGVLIAFTVGLLVFLGIDAALEGLEIAAEAPAAFGGPALVFAGALVAYLILAGVDAYLNRRGSAGGGGGPSPSARRSLFRTDPSASDSTRQAKKAAARRGAPASSYYLGLLVAIGIGLHNLGEGLAIGSAYAAGALALGAFLVVGFAIHNTTEGLAIVAPLREDGAPGASPGLGRLAGLGLIAGAPAILGAWIGAAAFDPSLAALLFGVGVGAIARVVVQLAPAMRNGDGRILHPLSVAGLIAGIVALYLTGLLVSV